jgi:hypothetical protein
MPMRRDTARGRARASLAGGWLLLSLTAALFALPASGAERTRPIASPQIRQLSTPFEVRGRGRIPHGVLTRRAAGRAASRSGSGRAPWRRHSPLQMRQLSQPRETVVDGRRAALPRRDLRRYSYNEARFERQPIPSREIVVDQLLITPRADDDDRLGPLTALGIPVLRGVPPVVIVNPPRAGRDPWDPFARRRTR